MSNHDHTLCHNPVAQQPIPPLIRDGDLVVLRECSYPSYFGFVLIVSPSRVSLPRTSILSVVLLVPIHSFFEQYGLVLSIISSVAATVVSFWLVWMHLVYYVDASTFARFQTSYNLITFLSRCSNNDVSIYSP